MISAIVVAAGVSSRMGEPKPLLRLGDRPLLEHVLSTLRRSRAGEVVAVLGHEADRVRADISLGGVTTVVNEAYAEGMSASIRAGIRAADPRSEGFLIVLGDQPFVSPATLDALIERHEGSAATILIPTYRGQRGNPVLVDRSLSEELQRITGDTGCRAIFGDHVGDVLEVPVDDPGILIDFDTPEQFARALDAMARGQTMDVLLAETRPEGAHDRPGHSSRPRPPVGRRRDVLSLAEELRSRNEPFVLATVVRAERPTSGRPGFKALVRSDREIVGWVGGSCAESALIAESLAALRDGRPRLLRLSPDPDRLRPQEGVVDYVMECHSGGAMDIYIEPHVPRAQLLVVGGSPVAEALVALGRLLDYRVVAVAPEAAEGAFPDADRVVKDLKALGELATAETYAVVATMGRYDETALRGLAGSRAAYVGLVASRRRGATVLDALRAAGVPEEAVARVRSPAGLDLSAQTPEEIALSIIAEITKARRTTTPPGPIVLASAPVEAQRDFERDVVCGMDVAGDAPLSVEHDGKTYVFCSEGCRSRFLEAPEAFLA